MIVLESVAMSKNHVPSPEEIAKIVEARLNGEEVISEQDLQVVSSPTSIRATREKVDQLAGQVAQLKAKRGPTTVEEVRKAFDLALKQFNLEPVIELARMVTETREDADGEQVFRLDPGTRIRILELLAKFRMPTLKAVEVGGSVSHEHKITIVRFGEDGSVRQEKVKNDAVAPIVEIEGEVARG